MLLLVAQEHGGLGDREVHPRRGDGRQRLDRTGEFAFEPALVIDLLLELRGPQLLVFHQLEADDAALGQALRGEAQARVVDLLLGHEDRAAALRHPVGDVHLVLGRDHRAAVAGHQTHLDVRVTEFRRFRDHAHVAEQG